MCDSVCGSGILSSSSYPPHPHPHIHIHTPPRLPLTASSSAKSSSSNVAMSAYPSSLPASPAALRPPAALSPPLGPFPSPEPAPPAAVTWSSTIVAPKMLVGPPAPPLSATCTVGSPARRIARASQSCDDHTHRGAGVQRVTHRRRAQSPGPANRRLRRRFPAPSRRQSRSPSPKRAFGTELCHVAGAGGADRSAVAWCERWRGMPARIPGEAGHRAARGRAPPRVMRNCLSLGRYGRRELASPALHCHMGQRKTSWSPAATNSSGVSTPLLKKCELFSVGVRYSRMP